MKEIVGYLLDRETGAGVSGKTVTFTKLDGSPVTSADTYWQNTGSGVTDANGMFTGRFELSPGPINVHVTASGSEVKVRKHNEKAMFGYQWSSDISRIARGTKGVIGGYLNALQVSCPSGHTIRIATGAAIFNGAVFSIENNYMDIAGTPNNNSGISTRVDLVTLRQYNETASGQLAGKQQVVITEGVSNNVAPATPVGANFVDFPLATVKTAYGASSKTFGKDLREYTGDTNPVPYVPPALLQAVAPTTLVSSSNIDATSSPATLNMGTVTISGLDAAKVYDGEVEVVLPITANAQSFDNSTVVNRGQATFIVNTNTFVSSGQNNRNVGVWGGAGWRVAQWKNTIVYTVPISGVTGVTSYTFNAFMKFLRTGSTGDVQVTTRADVYGSVTMTLKARE